MEIGCWFGAITMNVISWYGPCLHWKIAECSKSSRENMEQCYKVIVSLRRNVRNNRKKLRMMWLGAERWIKNDEWTELCRNVCVSVFFFISFVSKMLKVQYPKLVEWLLMCMWECVIVAISFILLNGTHCKVARLSFYIAYI